MSEEITCSECGITFGVPDAWIRDKRDNGNAFYCPNGHPRVFRKSTADTLREELSAERQRKARMQDELRAAQDSLRRARDAAVRLQKRTAAGVCPCCNRTFVQLARHMKSKHPEKVRA